MPAVCTLPISQCKLPLIDLAAAAAVRYLVLPLPVAADMCQNHSTFKPSFMLHTTTIPTTCSLKKHAATAPIIIPKAIVTYCLSLLFRSFQLCMHHLDIVNLPYRSPKQPCHSARASMTSARPEGCSLDQSEQLSLASPMWASQP